MARLTIRRRTAAGSAQLLELNGVAPNSVVELPPSHSTRDGTTVEFGCFSPLATNTVEVVAFRTERAVLPVSIKIKPGSDEPSITWAPRASSRWPS